MPKIDLSGVILAGGNNRRMGGSHKALLSFHHEKLIQRQIRCMKQICTEIILVANEPSLFLPLIDSDVKIIPDHYSGKGPLDGIYTALPSARNAPVWIIGCDMPFVSPQAAKLMLDLKEARNKDAVIPYVDGRLHPLHGIYDKRCADVIPDMMSKGQYRVMDFLTLIAYERATEWIFQLNGIDSKFILNVNTPEEYERSLSIDRQEKEDH